MVSDFRQQGRENWGDRVFEGIPVGADEEALVRAYLDAHDSSPNTRRAIRQDLRKLASWFAQANQEPFTVARVTIRDVSDCRDYPRREKGQAVSTVNRCLVIVRGYFGWLAEQGHIPANPAKKVKELRRQQRAPKGLDRSQVRRLLREIELRQDVRAGAIFSLFLYTGCRVSDLVNLELHDLLLGERSDAAVFKYGSGAAGRRRRRWRRWASRGGPTTAGCRRRLGRGRCRRNRYGRCKRTKPCPRKSRRCWTTPGGIRRCGTGSWPGGWWTRTAPA